MTDDAMQLLSDFRREIPFPDERATRIAYERVAGRGERRRRSVPRRIGAAAVVVGLLFAAVAVAAVTEAPWWQSGEPPLDPQQVVSVARDNLPAHVDVARARTVATAGHAALVAAPLNATGYCLIPALDGRATLGAQCEYQVANPQRGDDDRTVSATRAADGDEPAAWIVYGRITDPRARAIDLGAFRLELAPGGFFLGEVPETRWSRLSGAATSGAILDAAGHVLRRGCVNWATAPSDGARDGEYPLPLWHASSGGECVPERPPVLPTVDLTHARKLFDVTLTHDYAIWKSGQTITFEAARRSDGTTCLVATGPDVTPGVRPNGCAAYGAASASRPIDVGIGATLSRVAGTAVYVWDISGSVDPDRNIAKLELRSGASTTAVSLGGGFFFAQLPATTPGPRAGTVPMPPGQWLLVALDASGREVARVDLVALHARASPR